MTKNNRYIVLHIPTGCPKVTVQANIWKTAFNKKFIKIISKNALCVAYLSHQSRTLFNIFNENPYSVVPRLKAVSTEAFLCNSELIKTSRYKTAANPVIIYLN